MRKDIFGVTPQLQDIIVYNPAQYKGLVHGVCVGYTKSGLPLVLIHEKFRGSYLGQTSNHPHHYTPKTGFVVIKNEHNV
jgi:hypothetical protein